MMEKLTGTVIHPKNRGASQYLKGGSEEVRTDEKMVSLNAFGDANE